jgi:SAM-dependent methyltransferase
VRNDDERAKRALVFGEVAEQYDRARPTYPPELVDHVVAAIPDAPNSRVLEVGAGTGKATVLFAPRVGSLVALEPDPAMATIAERHARSLDGVSVVVDGFENWVTTLPPFDAILAAHCWHWVDPRIAYSKAGALIRPEGVLAAFWNVPDIERSPLYGPINDAYREHAPSLEDKTASTRRSFRDTVARHPGFRIAEQREFDWDLDYTAAEYTEMLSTHSDHHLLPDAQRDALMQSVARVIDEAGGTITLRYETMLVLLVPEAPGQ